MSQERDLIIIGGGAAGMAAAQYGARANLKTLLIESMAPGGQALLIDNLENYPGFPEPVNGLQFSQDMETQAKKFGAEVVLDTVESMSKENNAFTVKTTEETYIAKTVILATGAQHRHLGVKGEEELSGRGVSYCATCDGPFFRNQRILVVGGGDAACDEAVYLANLTDKVTMAHRRDRFRAQKSVAGRALNNPNITVKFNTVVKEIKGDEKVKSVLFSRTDTGEEFEEEFEAVFIFIGSVPQTDLVPDAKTDEAGYIITNEHMETNIKGLYAVGDVRNTPFRQLAVAVGDGAIAAHSASAYIDELKGQAYI